MRNLFERVDELWLPVPGFDGYLVSNLGRVFSEKRNKVLKPINNGKGYLCIDLYKSNKVCRKLIHRLVLSAFCQTADSTLQVNHKNGVKTDNRLENLAWVTQSENQRHSVYQLGNTHGRKRKSVGQFTRNGQLIAEYRSAYEASRATGVNRRSISYCANNHPRVSHAGGYKWSFLEETSFTNAA